MKKLLALLLALTMVLGLAACSKEGGDAQDQTSDPASAAPAQSQDVQESEDAGDADNAA